jgi:hypothetical protein
VRNLQVKHYPLVMKEFSGRSSRRATISYFTLIIKGVLKMFEQKLREVVSATRSGNIHKALDLFDEVGKLATTRQERERVHAEMVLLRLVEAAPYRGG